MAADNSRTMVDAETVTVSPETALDMAAGVAKRVEEYVSGGLTHVAEALAAVAAHLAKAGWHADDTATVDTGVLREAWLYAPDDTPLTSRHETCEVLHDN